MLNDTAHEARDNVLYSLTLSTTAQRFGIPAHARLKALLKFAQRGLGLRCVEVRQISSDDEPVHISEVVPELMERISQRGSTP